MKEMLDGLLLPSVQQYIQWSDQVLMNRLITIVLEESVTCLTEVDVLADSWQTFKSSSSTLSVGDFTPSEYVQKLFAPLKSILAFMSDHELDHMSASQKHALIYNVLNAVSTEYWNKMKTAKERMSKFVDTINKRRTNRRLSESNIKTDTMSGADLVEKQFVTDVRHFMHQLQDYIGNIAYLNKQHDTKYSVQNINNWADFCEFVEKANRDNN
ncbi:hypothetical protein RFI_34283 [Reticulomyxa filosa]|nr:hypothetical protein RFI_34283 [Reticulomyxa filosa]|eukprot:ETO03127.1 hypothetical protein RFI_34283 [Reticulomyxa filosa]